VKSVVFANFLVFRTSILSQESGGKPWKIKGMEWDVSSGGWGVENVWGKFSSQRVTSSEEGTEG
jgi:hypothetical protein